MLADIARCHERDECQRYTELSTKRVHVATLRVGECDAKIPLAPRPEKT